MKAFGFYVFQTAEFTVLGVPISFLYVEGLSQSLLAFEFHIKKIDADTASLL
jgi:hypothetical protein